MNNFERVFGDYKKIEGYFPAQPPVTELETLKLQRLIVRSEFRTREKYCNCLRNFMICGVIALIFFAILFNAQASLFLSRVVIPMSPLVAWCVQEFAQHRRTLGQFKKVLEQLDLAIELSGTSSNSWTLHFQDQIFRLRASAPFVLNCAVMGLRRKLPISRLIAIP